MLNKKAIKIFIWPYKEFIGRNVISGVRVCKNEDNYSLDNSPDNSIDNVYCNSRPMKGDVSTMSVWCRNARVP